MVLPTLAICGISEIFVWRISSVIMLVVLVPWLVTYPIRRKNAAPDQNFSLRGYVLNTLGPLAAIFLRSGIFFRLATHT
jgi:hydrogenase-4 membrane subunit HyfE